MINPLEKPAGCRWIRAGALALAGLVLVACATGPRSPLDDPEAMSALMVRLGEDLYSGTARCLPQRDYSVKVIDDRHLLFRQRDVVWINQLRVRCPGLRWAGRGSETLAFEPTGSRLCAMDGVRVFDSSSRRSLSGPRCPLGEFRQIDQGVIEEIVGPLP